MWIAQTQQQRNWNWFPSSTSSHPRSHYLPLECRERIPNMKTPCFWKWTGVYFLIRKKPMNHSWLPTLPVAAPPAPLLQAPVSWNECSVAHPPGTLINIMAALPHAENAVSFYVSSMQLHPKKTSDANTGWPPGATGPKLILTKGLKKVLMISTTQTGEQAQRDEAPSPKSHSQQGTGPEFHHSPAWLQSLHLSHHIAWSYGIFGTPQITIFWWTSAGQGGGQLWLVCYPSLLGKISLPSL